MLAPNPLEVPTDPPHRIALLGLGLIGGSMGLALRRHAPDLRIVGFDPDAADSALARGACTDAAETIEAACADADLIVLAAPVGRLPDLLARAAVAAPPTALLTDVGSVKGPIADMAQRLGLGERFVGGHPMAGAERGGIANADALLFENALYALCPSSGRPAPDRAVWLAEAVGARPIVLSPLRHDALAATVSHVPQLLAVALVEAATAAGDDALALAAGGFRDMTRIASSPFGLWGDIYAANASAVTDALDALLDRLERYRSLVSDDADGLRPAFERAARARHAMPADARGFLAPLVDVVVWAEDRPGVLYALTGVLARAQINILDIELMRVREGDAGTFRIGFADAATADAAVQALADAGTRARRR